MALTTCPECGKEVSSEAKICPHCGIELSSKIGDHRWFEKKGLVIFLLFILFPVGLFGLVKNNNPMGIIKGVLGVIIFVIGISMASLFLASFDGSGVWAVMLIPFAIGVMLIYSGIKLIRNKKSLSVKVDEPLSEKDKTKNATTFYDNIEKQKDRRPAREPEVHIKSLNFTDLKMAYTKAENYEPEEYIIKAKDLCRRGDRYYIKAVKKGEKIVKSFRVDRIESMTMGGIQISNPIDFFLNGEIVAT